MLSPQAGNSLVILLIIAGLLTGGVLIERSIEKNSHPSPQPSVEVPQTNQGPSLALSTDPSLRLDQLKAGDTFTVSVSVSTKETINVISTKIKYPKDIVKVTAVEAVEKDNPVSLWVTKEDVPEESVVQLVGGIPTPGFSSEKRVEFAKITFQLLVEGKQFSLDPSETELYSNQTNQPLSDVRIINLNNQPPAQPSPVPSPSVQPTMNPAAKGSISLSPSVIQTASSCTFDLMVNYDSGGSDFLGIDALLTFDPRVLKPVSIVTSDNKPDALHGPQLSFSNDTVTIAYIAPTTRPYQKQGALGKITFKVTDQKAQGMTVIKVKNSHKTNDLTDSNILTSLSQDILATTKDTYVLVKNGNCNDNQPGSYEILPTR